MSSGLSDPNNHAPEVSPDDGWDDTPGPSPQDVPTPVVLPPRRKSADRPVSVTESAAEPGLRIDPGNLRVEPVDEQDAIEVREMGAPVIRLEQEIQRPPKVARHVEFHERPARETNGPDFGGESEESGKSKFHPVLWVVGAGGLVAALVIGAMWLRPAINAPNVAREATEPKQEAVTEEEGSGNVEFEAFVSRQAEATRLFRAYTRAVHVDDLLPLVRDGGSIKADLKTHWKPGNFANHAPASIMAWKIVERENEPPFGLLEGSLPDHVKFNACFVVEDDRLLLDWKASTAFGTATFAQLEKGQGDPTEIRGTLSRSDFYTGVWREEEYQSYQLISPDYETNLWCYTRRNSMDQAKLERLFSGGSIVRQTVRARQVTLRLERGPEGTAPNQWLIGEMLHTEWVRP